MNKFLIKNFFLYIGLFVLISTSIYLGESYAIYNQDYHHSFFILSSFIDFQNGLKIFKEIFLQYGPGQIFLFTILSKLININLYSIYFITTIIYSINLLILFKVFKKIFSIQISLTIIFIIFLVHPYNIYAWPDYYSGLCLTLFFYFFFKENNKIRNNLICAGFLFLAILFRSTYIINIGLSALFFIILNFYFFKKEKLNQIFIFLFSFIVIFFIGLLLFNNLGLWYSQSIGFITSYANETKHAYLYEQITKYLGKEGFIFFKIIYYGIRSFISLLDISNAKNIIFIFFIIINIIYIFQTIKKKIKLNKFEKKIFFVSMLGLTGFVQSLMLMEVFRNINATIGIFISGIYLIKEKNFFWYYFKKYSNLFISLLITYIIILIYQFPVSNYDKENFKIMNNLYFSKNKKIEAKIYDYYSELATYICTKHNIHFINLTNDIGISYLCNNKKNKLSMPPAFLKKINLDQYVRLVEKNLLYKDEILLSSKKITSENIILLKKIKTPHIPKDWYGDIYFYKKK